LGTTEHVFQSKFSSFTAHQFLKTLRDETPYELANYLSTQADRTYHFWERRPKWIAICNIPIFQQKLSYLHNNPLAKKWNLVCRAEDYLYSSCSFYETGESQFADMLTMVL